jgi:hypothetical protein
MMGSMSCLGRGAEGWMRDFVGSLINRPVPAAAGALFAALALAFLASCSGDGTVGLKPGQAAAIAINVGNNQSAAVASALGIAPSVIVKDVNGNPVAGVVVVFTVASGGGTIAAATQITGTDGIAQSGPWTLGVKAGANTLSAAAAGVTTGPVIFTATGLPGALAHLDEITTATTGTAGLVLTQPPQVRAADGNLNPISGVPVTFAVTSGGGSITGATQITGADGAVTLGSWTLGTVAGVNTLAASTPGLSSLTITRTGMPGPATKLVFLTQPSNAGWRVALAPSVQVAAEDQFSNVETSSTDPITLTLAASPGGVTLTGGGTVTPTNGIATFPQLLLDQPGTGYKLSAATASGTPPAQTSVAFDVSPVGVVATSRDVDALTVAGSSAYFTTSGSPIVSGLILTVPLTGGIPTQLGTSGRSNRIIVDGTGLAVLSTEGENLREGLLTRFALPSGPVSAVGIAPGNQVDGPDFETDSTYYYTAFVPWLSLSDPHVFGIQRVRGDGSATYLVSSPYVAQVFHRNFTIAGRQLYYTDSTAGGMSIQLMSTDSGPSTPLVTGLGPVAIGVRRLIVIGNTIYWGESTGAAGSGSIRSAPITGGSATTRVSGLTNPQNFVSDGTSLYVSDQGSLIRIRLSDFSATTMASDSAIVDIALDAQAVYWSNGSAIKKTAK